MNHLELPNKNFSLPQQLHFQIFHPYLSKIPLKGKDEEGSFITQFTENISTRQHPSKWPNLDLSWLQLSYPSVHLGYALPQCGRIYRGKSKS